MNMAKVKFLTAIGRCKYPHLNKPDAAFDADNPKYKTELLMSAEDAAPLIELIKATAAEVFGPTAKYRLPISKDEETGEVSIKAQSRYQPHFFDTKGQVITPSALPRISGGSQVRIGGTLNPYTVSGTKGVSLMLEKAQIVEVSEGGSGPDGGFDAIEGGFVIGSMDDGGVDLMERLKTDVTKDDFDF